jgi:hypothetical protein
VETDAEIKQTVIAILTSVRDGNVSPEAELFTGHGRPRAPVTGRQALTAATYAMTLFQMLAAEYEAACPDADVRDFLQRRALEAAKDGEAA